MRTLCLILMVVGVHYATAERVHILFDASLSMSLPAGERDRVHRSLDHLPYLLEELGADEAALSFLHAGAKLEYAGEFPVINDLYRRIRSEPLYGRASPTRALFALASRSGHDLASTRVVLVTDGEELMPARAPLPAFADIVILHLAGPSLRHGFDTAFLSSRAVRVVTVPLDGSSPADTFADRGGEAGDEPQRSLLVQSPPEQSSTGRFARALLIVLAFVGALAAVGLLSWLAREQIRYQRLLARARAWNERVPELTLAMYGQGFSETVVVAGSATVGFGPGYAVNVPEHLASPGFTQADTLTVTREADTYVLSSTSAFRYQGLEKEIIPIREGLEIRLGRFKLRVHSVEQKRERREPRPYHFEKLPWLAALVLLTTVPAFLSGRVGLQARPGLNPSTDVTTVADRDDRPAVVRHFDSPPAPVVSRRRQPLVLNDREPVPFFDADFLAIHAHPDDESLDFGSLLAALTATGRRGVQILLTDGESGQDLFPERTDHGRYPQYELRGQDLARVRITEATEALRWLGVDHYVRLQLPNYPYNALTDEISPQEVLVRWGGVSSLADRVASLIEGYKPELLISPDGPSPVIEHFEHDATGIVTSLALDLLNRRGVNPVQTHLVSIDPLQVPDDQPVVALDVWRPVAPNREPPRVYQLHALAAHLTQLDASVNGLETRHGLAWEYYQVRSGVDEIAERYPRLPLVVFPVIH